MFNTVVGAGAVGAGAGVASHYGSGSGSDQKMRLLAALAPQHCYICSYLKKSARILDEKRHVFVWSGLRRLKG
jgi:hypothetical protein